MNINMKFYQLSFNKSIIIFISLKYLEMNGKCTLLVSDLIDHKYLILVNDEGKYICRCCKDVIGKHLNNDILDSECNISIQQLFNNNFLIVNEICCNSCDRDLGKHKRSVFNIISLNSSISDVLSITNNNTNDESVFSRKENLIDNESKNLFKLIKSNHQKGEYFLNFFILPSTFTEISEKYTKIKYLYPNENNCQCPQSSEVMYQVLENNFHSESIVLGTSFNNKVSYEDIVNTIRKKLSCIFNENLDGYFIICNHKVKYFIECDIRINGTIKKIADGSILNNDYASYFHKVSALFAQRCSKKDKEALIYVIVKNLKICYEDKKLLYSYNDLIITLQNEISTPIVNQETDDNANQSHTVNIMYSNINQETDDNANQSHTVNIMDPNINEEPDDYIDRLLQLYDGY